MGGERRGGGGGSFGRGRRRRIAGLVAVGLLSSLAAPASAAIVERDRYGGTYEFSFDDCGFEIEVVGTFSGRYHIRQGRPEADATPFHLLSKDRFEETLTGNGTTLTVRGHETFNENRARYVGEAVFEFDRTVAGQRTVHDAAGNMLYRDRGVLVFTYLFDKTTSPRAPGGQFVRLVDVQVRGPHPWHDLAHEPFCALFGEPPA